MRSLFFCFTAIILSISLQAQNYSIKGIVKDSVDKPIDFATVMLLNEKDSSFIKSAFSNEKGEYNFDKISKGNYILSASLVGFQTSYTNIAYNEIPVSVDMIIKAETQALKEVEVTYKVPVVERFAGKTVLNVENSIVGQGTSALELLKQAPGVVVTDGNIALQGKNNVLVMIDDRPTYLNATQVTNLLRSMPSNQISKIEVITNPSAKYDASGNAGIINIKLKKKKTAGFHLGLDVTYAQGIRPGTIDGLNFNFKKNKWNFFGDYHFTLFTDREWVTLERVYQVPVDSTVTLSQSSKGDQDYFSHPFKFGIDFYATEKTTVGVLVNGDLGHFKFGNHTTTNESDLNAALLQSNNTANNNKYKYGNVSSNIYTKHTFDSIGRELTVNFDYANYFNRSDDRYVTHYFDRYNNENADPFQLTDNQRSVYNIFAVKADATIPIKKQHTIETGVKSSIILTNNDLKMYNYYSGIQTIDSIASNHFDYRENINAVYTSYEGSIKHFTFMGGLRMEQTNNHGISKDVVGHDSTIDKHYIDLFPSATILYKPTEKHTISLSYNRRIDRPTYDQLNPFIFFLDPYSYHIGSPYLTPQYTHNVSLSYSYKSIVTFSINYSLIKNRISDVIRIVENTKKSYHTTTNIGNVSRWNISVSVPTNITKWWFTNTYVEMNAKKQTDIEEGIKTKDVNWLIQSNHQFTLPKGFSIESNFFFQSKATIGNMRFNPLFNWTMGFQKSFKNNMFTIKATVNDILYTMKLTAYSDVQGLDLDVFRRKNDSRALFLTFSYNLDKNNAGQHSDRKTGLEEEKKRAGNGGGKN